MRTVERDKYLHWLSELQNRVCDQLVLTIYPVEKDADAGVIFEVMNNRGKPISEMEKAKNYLLYLAAKLELDEPHDLAERINSTWTHILRDSWRVAWAERKTRTSCYVYTG
jgi:hypothetical protein